jgi:hypothetical protein
VRHHETVQRAKEHWGERTFNAGYERVYKASSVLPANRGDRYEHGPEPRSNPPLTWNDPWSWGAGGDFRDKLADDQTEVEIISKPVVAPLNFHLIGGKLFDAILPS